MENQCVISNLESYSIMLAKPGGGLDGANKVNIKAS
jgi:hypothetical protein